MPAEWFAEWFDSPYYHVLYKNRDEKEAFEFINTLLGFLQPVENSSMLDLACGKGRYSRFLAEKGYDVSGLDLSTKSIEFAQEFESGNLSFFTHDMRKPFRINYFDYIFNFFTSFGYFQTEKEHLDTLKNIQKGLKKGGHFVLDFFNTEQVVKHLIPSEQKTIDGIHFEITKKIVDQKVIKRIAFTKNGKDLYFEEKVRLFRLDELEKMFQKTGLEIKSIFGDYYLNDFDLNESPRLILVAEG